MSRPLSFPSPSHILTGYFTFFFLLDTLPGRLGSLCSFKPAPLLRPVVCVQPLLSSFFLRLTWSFPSFTELSSRIFLRPISPTYPSTLRPRQAPRSPSVRLPPYPQTTLLPPFDAPPTSPTLLLPLPLYNIPIPLYHSLSPSTSSSRHIPSTSNGGNPHRRVVELPRVAF